MALYGERAPRMGDTPYFDRGWDEDLKRLFYTDPQHAHTHPITLLPGFGIVKQGTAIAQVHTAVGNRAGCFVPYVPKQPDPAGLGNAGAAYLLQDGAANKEVWVKAEDSWKFAVGDRLAVADTTNYSGQGTGAVDLGAVTAIDRDTYPHKHLVTVTNNVTTNFLVSRNAWVYHVTSVADASFTSAIGILQGGTDTGLAEDAKGGNGVNVIGNCMLYHGLLTNVDSDVVTALGGKVVSQYLRIP